jgi:hypothetical protein
LKQDEINNTQEWEFAMNGRSRMLSVLLVLIVCVVGFGFYSGWFALSRTSPDAGSHKVNINLTVDPDKVRADANAVKKKTSELADEATEGAKDLGDRAKDTNETANDQ